MSSPAKIHGGAVIDPTWKGIPADLAGMPVGSVGKTGRSILDEDWPTPCAYVRESEARHNVAVMSRYCADHGVSLAPHAKTTMAPLLLDMQLAAGAWALTVANVSQLRSLHACGYRRFIHANEVVDTTEARWLLERLREDDDIFVLVFADSIAAIDILADAAGEDDVPSLGVLIEMGIVGGRCGLRDPHDAVALAEHAVNRGLRVAGVAGFEGIVGMERNEETATRARAFGGVLAQVAGLLRRAGLHTGGDVIATAGGSLFFDDVLAGWNQLIGDAEGTHFVLRSGCYITMDHGAYTAGSPLAYREGASPEKTLRPAIEVASRVVSAPEADLWIVNAGKRDVSYDVANPIALWHRDPARRIAAGASRCIGLNDQHAIFRGSGVSDLSVGDRIGLGISHPCTTFDKWRAIPIVDDHLSITDLALTLL